MNVETLKYFQYIAKYKNITQAAKHLYISQSTLSRHIMSLENELGVKLFERNNKMVTLTEAGKMLYNDSDSFINHMDSLIKSVEAAGKGHSGILKITAPKSLYHTVSDVMHATQAEHSAIKYFVESYDFNEIPLAIKYNLYHIGISYDFALSDQESLDYVPIDSDEFCIIYSAKYDEGDLAATLKKVVQSTPFILPGYANPPSLQQIQVTLQDLAGCKIHSTIEVNSSDSLVLNTSLGLGYGLLPNSWARLLSEENHLSILPLPEVATKVDIVAICKKATTSELTASAFDVLKKISAEHRAK